MKYNYHAHTPRCSHATGTPEEYVLRALEGKMTHIGFSDHCPLQFDDGYQTYWKVPVEEGGDYCNEIAALRDKYRDKIDIKIGFEMEYYPALFPKTFKKVIGYGAEYLILGQHFISPDMEHPGYVHTVVGTNSLERLIGYTDVVCSAIKTGVFTYVAHPDIFNFTGESKLYQRYMRKICEASLEYNTPLEINLLGIRQKRNYPNEEFWHLAAEVGAPVVFGADAHTAPDVYDADSISKAKKMVKDFGLNYIGRPKIIDIREI